MASERTLIIFNMNSPRTEKRRLEIKMKLIDSEMPLLSRKENAKIMMPKSRAWTTISTKLKRKPKNSVNWLMLKISRAEELLKLLTVLLLSSLEPRRITPDSWLNLKLSKETLMVN
jgi:hypothetical protein